jgi:hypothetical protein
VGLFCLIFFAFAKFLNSPLARFLNYFNLNGLERETHLKKEAGVNFSTRISTIVLFASLCSFAGIDLRIGGGLNLSNEIYSGDFELSDTYKKHMHIGFNEGWGMALYFTEQLGVFAGLNCETRGSGWKVDDPISGDSRSAEFSMWYLQIPLLFSFKPIPALAINLGPELGIFLSGKSKVGSVTMYLDEIKLIDFGASITADYTIADMIAVGAGYYFGLLNNDDRPRGASVKGSSTNTNIKLYVAYVFHWKEYSSLNHSV